MNLLIFHVAMKWEMLELEYILQVIKIEVLLQLDVLILEPIMPKSLIKLENK